MFFTNVVNHDILDLLNLALYVLDPVCIRVCREVFLFSGTKEGAKNIYVSPWSMPHILVV